MARRRRDPREDAEPLVPASVQSYDAASWEAGIGPCPAELLEWVGEVRWRQMQGRAAWSRARIDWLIEQDVPRAEWSRWPYRLAPEIVTPLPPYVRAAR